MSTVQLTQVVEQIHIDVARNATDDFNPFHDKHRWQNIASNPFKGPIVLGFQLANLATHAVREHRDSTGDSAMLQQRGLRYSNYELRFVDAVAAGQSLQVSVRASRFKPGGNPNLSNRVTLRVNDKLVATGYKRDSEKPMYLGDLDPACLGQLGALGDRSYLPDGKTFLKRKFLTTSNAKNFLCGSLIEQSEYIDEVADKVRFPEIYPVALLSSALLEQAKQRGHDFENQPLVYRSHKVSIDRHLAGRLHSNDALHLLVRQDEDIDGQTNFICYGIVNDDSPLFRAYITMTPLGVDHAG